MDKLRKRCKKSNILIVIMLIIMTFAFFAPFFNLTYKSSKADAIEYSSVYDDLQKDERFNIEDFAVDETDYSINLFQIAESVNNELFVYVYQPCSPEPKLNAVSINLSTNEGEYYIVYSLTLLDSYTTVYKYLVNGFSVSNAETRYYDISSISRAWNEDFDAPLDNGNTISEVAFDVGKQYIVTGFGDDIQYSVADTETVEITDKYVGFVRYEGGYTWDAVTYKSADNHFVAFSTNHNIDVLLEADVYYTQRSRHYYAKADRFSSTYPPGMNVTETFGDEEEKYVNLQYDDVEDYQGNIFHKKYTWNKICSVADFIEGENHSNVYHVIITDVRKETSLTSEGLQNLQNKEWVLRFATTDYSYKHIDGNLGGLFVTEESTEINATEIMNVSILRLKFESDGIVYNLGVVDNKQTGDDTPDNDTETTFDGGIAGFFSWIRSNWSIILSFFIVALIITILIVIFGPSVILWIIKAIWKIIVWIFKGIWWLICLPFKLFKKEKE